MKIWKVTLLKIEPEPDLCSSSYVATRTAKKVWHYQFLTHAESKVNDLRCCIAGLGAIRELEVTLDSIDVIE